MNEPTPPIIAGFLGEKIALRPGFAGALRGVWLLTWRSQMSWRRLPGRVALLLVLPLLVWITVQSPLSWTRRHEALSQITPPGLNRFFRRAQDTSHPLASGQKDDLAQVVDEEYATTALQLRDAQTDPDLDTQVKREREASDGCSERILNRARKILDDAQFARFKTYESVNKKKMDDLISSLQSPWGRTAPFYHWLVDVYFFLILPLGCVRGCGALMRDELQADTLGFLVTRPVSRARLLCVKFLSQLAWLQVLLLTETLLLFAVGGLRQIPELRGLLPLFLAVQVLAVPAWCALGTFLGQVSNRYMAIALLYGGIVEMGIGRIPTNINALSIMRHLKTLLSNNAALQGIYDWPMDTPWLAIGALAVAPVLFLGLAALLFSFLEYLPASEMQK